MLTVGQTKNVTFKVNVMGTQSEPRVRVILGANPELSFEATRDGESWNAPMNIPMHLAPGSYDLRVEVVLNNRLFTPVNKKIDVSAGEHSNEPVQAAATGLPVFAPAPKAPVASLIDLVSSQDEAPPKEIVMPKVVAKLPKVELKAKPKVESTEPVKPAALSLLSTIAKATPKRKFEALRSGMPKPSDKKAEPIRVKISEINAATAEIVSHVREACATAKAEVKKTNKKPKTPVKLVKEHLIYE